MLTVQVSYLNVVELERHNKQTEKEMNRHNIQEENLGFANLAEVKRHNLATEQELGRHNLVSEQQTDMSLNLQAQNVAETHRANVAREKLQSAANAIQAGGLTEAIRTHKANEVLGLMNTMNERRKINLEEERFDVQSAQGWQSLSNQKFANETNRMNARTNERNAEINQQNADTSRMNAYTNMANTLVNAIHNKRSDSLRAVQSLLEFVPKPGAPMPE